MLMAPSCSRTKRWSLFLYLMLLKAGSAPAADPPALLDYRTGSWFLPQTPGVTAGPVGGLFNPGAFAMTDRAGFDAWMNDSTGHLSFNNFGFATGRRLNFAMNRSTVPWRDGEATVNDWQVGLAGGRRAGTVGIGYRWSSGSPADELRDRALVMGIVSRPTRWLTWGASRAQSLEANAAQNIFDLGLRPAAAPWLTLFGDWTLDDGQAFLRQGSWGAGFEIRPIRGLHMGVRLRERRDGGEADVAAMIGITTLGGQFSGQSVVDDSEEVVLSSWLSRSNPPFAGRDFEASFKPGTTYVALDLQKKVLSYQKHRWFDDEHVAWLDLLALLDAVRDDKHLDALAVNMAGLSGRPSLMWELREKLREIRAGGKRVIIYADRLQMGSLHLATAADCLVLDPRGNISLPGLVLTRSYLKGTLEKLGIGFQEHRYYKYKSAAETLSRDSMSPADREQRQRIVDVIYETLRDGIADGRGHDAAALEATMDSLGFLTPHEALQAKLIDKIGRWDDVLSDLTEEGAREGVWPQSLTRRYWDEQWGQPARIPVVFAVGECAMDTGIRGRTTGAWLSKLAKDPTVAAVVLRVDSPGGDPLPSDLVTSAVRKLIEAGKPVIISQGDVAASGGYWISMDGSRILTTPVTITGSIGVISGWIWDDGLSDKAGVKAESVQRGRHADLYSEIGLPMVGSLPRRPMNDEELTRVEAAIRRMYDDFVSSVARARGMDIAAVDSVAQGRVWMGRDAIDLGLCDSVGGLSDAITEARRMAGIPEGREVEIYEYPPRRLFKLPKFGLGLGALAGLFDDVAGKLSALLGGMGGDGAPLAAVHGVPILGGAVGALESSYLAAIGREPGRPLTMLPPDALPDGWRQLD